MTYINAKAALTDDTDINCYIKAVELVEHLFGNNHLPVKHSFTQVSSKYQRTHFWDFENARKLAMPQMKLGIKFSLEGFWICNCMKICFLTTPKSTFFIFLDLILFLLD